MTEFPRTLPCSFKGRNGRKQHLIGNYTYFINGELMVHGLYLDNVAGRINAYIMCKGKPVLSCYTSKVKRCLHRSERASSYCWYVPMHRMGSFALEDDDNEMFIDPRRRRDGSYAMYDGYRCHGKCKDGSIYCEAHNS